MNLRLFDIWKHGLLFGLSSKILPQLDSYKTLLLTWCLDDSGGLFLYLAKSYLDEHESPQMNITEIVTALLGECKRLLRSLMTIAENVLWLTWPISALGTGESEPCILSVGI